MTELTRIAQLRDTKIELRVSQAFAVVEFRFVDGRGNHVHISLDMESAIDVLCFMDDGPNAVDKLRKWYDPRGWFK